MDEKIFERELRNTLHTCADELEAPEEMEARLKFAMKLPAKHRRPRWGKRMIAVAAAAALVVVGAFAAGMGGSITSHSWANQRMDFAETTEHFASISENAVLAEELPDGFAFEYGYDVQSTAEFEGQTEDIPSVSAVYQSGDVTLNYDVQLPYTVLPDETESRASETRTVNGVDMTFIETNYLFVPADYTPTDDEVRAEARGELAISYGASEVTSDTYQYVSWEKDGVSCSLSGFSTGLTADDLFDIAAELT